MPRGSGLAVLLACALAAPAAADIGFFGDVETWAPANADQGIKDGFVGAAQDLSGIGYAVSEELTTRAAVGGRVGVRAPLSELLELGVSLGYIRGPDSKGSVSVSAPGLSGTDDYRRQVQFFRALLEPELVLPFRGGDSALHIAGGAGIARGSSLETIVCHGSACVQDGSKSTGKAAWTGFASEAALYVSLRQFTLGARYAAFPKFKGSANGTRFEWATTGFFVGVRF